MVLNKIMMRRKLESVFKQKGFDNFKWLDPKEIVVSYWARMKCRFGCDEYGNNACCPPNVPSVSECISFFREYKEAVVFRFIKKVEHPEDRWEWTKEVNLKLLDLERSIFMKGYYKAFLLFLDSCNICSKCTGDRDKCKHPVKARPTPEALAVDVFATVRKLNYPIQVLSDYSQEMNRYAFLLIE